MVPGIVKQEQLLPASAACSEPPLSPLHVHARRAAENEMLMGRRRKLATGVSLSEEEERVSIWEFKCEILRPAVGSVGEKC